MKENFKQTSVNETEEEAKIALTKTNTLFGWYLILCHLLVISFYCYHWNRAETDGRWNNPLSYAALCEKKSNITWSSYIVYLFFVTVDTPSSEARKEITSLGNYHRKSEDNKNDIKGDYVGVFVTLLLFIAWCRLIIWYYDSSGSTKQTYMGILIALSLWLLYEAIKIHPYLS